PGPRVASVLPGEGDRRVVPVVREDVQVRVDHLVDVLARHEERLIALEPGPRYVHAHRLRVVEILALPAEERVRVQVVTVVLVEVVTESDVPPGQRVLSPDQEAMAEALEGTPRGAV